MDNISEEYRPSIFIYFAQVMQDREFSCSSKRDLAQYMVREALDQVAVVFIVNRRSHPFKDGKQLDYKLDLLMKEYYTADFPEQ